MNQKRYKYRLSALLIGMSLCVYESCVHAALLPEDDSLRSPSLSRIQSVLTPPDLKDLAPLGWDKIALRTFESDRSSAHSVQKWCSTSAGLRDIANFVLKADRVIDASGTTLEHYLAPFGFLRDNWSSDLHAWIQVGLFHTPSGRSLEEVMQEVRQANRSLPPALFDTLETQTQKVFQVLEQPLHAPCILQGFQSPLYPLNQWTKEDIGSWMRLFKQKPNKTSEFVPVVVGLMTRAATLVSHQDQFEVRVPQIVATLAALESLSAPLVGKGRFLQVSTGEGKTLITSMIAAAHTLWGRTVDVMSSSAILASEGARTQRDFYDYLNLTCDSLESTEDEDDGCADNARAYTRHIVYGSISDFSGDILRQDFKGNMSRKSRPFDVLIVDEVDNILLDNMQRMTYLAEPAPGMEFLLPVMAVLWQTINTVDWEKVSRDTARTVLTHQITQLLEDAKMTIPLRLQVFAHTQLPLWIDSAFDALLSQENKDHILNRSGTVIPVDYNDTGMVQIQHVFTNGLQQFLQLKLGGYFTPETLLSSFLSTLGLINCLVPETYGLDFDGSVRGFSQIP